MRRGALAAFLATLLASCATPQPYRFAPVDNGSIGLILQPATRIRERAGEATAAIDIFDVLASPRACAAAPSDSLLAWRLITAGSDGRSARALRLEGSLSTLRAPDFRAALRDWWPSSGLDKSGCLREGGADAVFRAVMGQRPLTADEAVSWWFGPGRGPAAPRIVVLRPGMRVCAHDVLLDQATESKYLPGSTHCARLIDTSSGPRFDSVSSRFSVPLDGTPWTIGVRFRRVTSWAEVQQPFDQPGARPAYILFYTATLKPPTGTEEPRTLPLILAADLAGSLMTREPPPLLERIVAASKTGDAEALCSEPEPDQPAKPIVCIQFGERATFTVDFPVRINGTALDVPVGATLGTVVGLATPDMLAADVSGAGDVSRANDPAASGRLLRTLGKVRLNRWYDGRSVRVRMDPKLAPNMPLQPGDDIRW